MSMLFSVFEFFEGRVPLRFFFFLINESILVVRGRMSNEIRTRVGAQETISWHYRSVDNLSIIIECIATPLFFFRLYSNSRDKGSRDQYPGTERKKGRADEVPNRLMGQPVNTWHV